MVSKSLINNSAEYVDGEDFDAEFSEKLPRK